MVMRNMGSGAKMKVNTINKFISNRKSKCLETLHYA